MVICPKDGGAYKSRQIPTELATTLPAQLCSLPLLDLSSRLGYDLSLLRVGPG